jgi:hypothetical protein
VKVNGRIWATSLIRSSDSRIKEDIQDINDENSLQSILTIEPKTYIYIDKVLKGDNKVHGFIAQQIREVNPEVVSIQTSYNLDFEAEHHESVLRVITHERHRVDHSVKRSLFPQYLALR